MKKILSNPKLNSADLKDRYGQTPVMTAIFYQKTNVLRALVAHPYISLDTDCHGKSLEEWTRWTRQFLLEALNQFVCCRARGFAGVTKKHQIIIFEYWVFSQKSYLNMGRFEKNIFAYQKFDFCIPKI